VDFNTCTAQALGYVSELLGVALSAADQQALLARYRSLPGGINDGPVKQSNNRSSSGEPQELTVMAQRLDQG
jgi:hypothetical protein